MKKVYVKEEVCIGCRLCEVYCRTEHSHSKNIIKAHKVEDPRPVAGVLVEETKPVSFAVQCRHCDEPICVESCITGALMKDETGKVVYNQEKCVGCWTCVLVCPHGAPQRDLERRKIAKCDLCPDRETPACVEGCPNQALVYEER
jgi:carbon-monoxide dehydrogenase iron sulfur subunit